MIHALCDSVSLTARLVSAAHEYSKSSKRSECSESAKYVLPVSL